MTTKKEITEQEMRFELQRMVKAGSQKAVAKDLGFTAQFICDVLYGQREVSDKLAAALGYCKVVRFIKETSR